MGDEEALVSSLCDARDRLEHLISRDVMGHMAHSGKEGEARLRNQSRKRLGVNFRRHDRVRRAVQDLQRRFEIGGSARQLRKEGL